MLPNGMMSAPWQCPRPCPPAVYTLIRPHCRLSLLRPRCSSSETPQEAVSEHSNAQASPSTSMPASQNGQGRVWLAVGAVGIAAAAALAGHVSDGGPALGRLQQASVPLESALSNGKPTVLEFYADWCEVCNELAPATLQVRSHALFAWHGRHRMHQQTGVHLP